MAKLSQPTKHLIQRYQDWYKSLQPKEDVITIHVDEVASQVASFYEKIRGVVEWKEEHLLRRTAVQRVLKRRLLTKKSNEKIAEPLIMELIRGGHFPNDKIPEQKIKEIQKLIDKYAFILENSPNQSAETQELRLFNWMASVAACEIEGALAPSIRENALIEYMTGLMRERIKLNEGTIVIGGITEEEKNIQIHIAVQRALFKLDQPMISYYLLKKKYSEWQDISLPTLKEIAANIYLIQAKIKNDLSHPLADKFYKVCEKYDTPYLLLGDILSQAPLEAEEKIIQPEILENSVKEAYNKRLRTLKSRLTRAAIYATLSIFITNIVSLLAIEIPFTKYVTGEFNFLAIGVDILGPTLLMAFLVITIKHPAKENLVQTIMEVTKIVYVRERKDVYEIRSYKKQGAIAGFIIAVLYILSFAFSVWIIFWCLNKLRFPPLSYLIFIIFLALIAFAGVKIRERAKELQVIEEKRRFSAFFLDLFSLPIIHLGKGLSKEWEKHNFLVAIINSIIEMPFQIFVEFLEQWRNFLKEKKEEIH